jgi:hypothetical protein
MASGSGLQKKKFSKKLGIIGGTDATLGQYPYAVALKVYDATEKFRCNGALFAHNLVITAGKSFDTLTGPEHFI